MEHGEIAPEQFMTGIKNMLTMMLNGCDAISEEETRRFQTRESIGTCPVCGRECVRIGVSTIKEMVIPMCIYW